MLTQAIENLLNRNLPRSPRARELCETLAGKRVQVEARGLVAAHAGQDSLTVYLGRRYHAIGPRRLAVDCREPADFERVLSSRPDIDVVYFLGGLETHPVGRRDVDWLDRTQELGALSLLHLVKALRRGRPVTLKVVTNDVHRVGPEDLELYPFGSSAIG